MPTIVTNRSNQPVRHGRHCAVLFTALSLLTASLSSLAATATLNGAYVTRVMATIETARGPSGRAFLAVDRHFDLAGVCQFAGTVDGPSGWMMEFHVEHPSYKSLLSIALTAQSTGRSVRIEYDDGFGAGTNCRITALEIKD